MKQLQRIIAWIWNVLPCPLLFLLYYSASEGWRLHWMTMGHFSGKFSFQEGSFIESKVKVKWSFPPHNLNRVLTLEGPTGFYSICFYLFILWSSILVMFLIWSSIFYNFIFVLLFLNLLIFWSQHHLTYQKKTKVISNQ